MAPALNRTRACLEAALKVGLRILAFCASGLMLGLCVAVFGLLGLCFHVLQAFAAGRRSGVDCPLDIHEVADRAHRAYLAMAGRDRSGDVPREASRIRPVRGAGGRAPMPMGDVDVATFGGHCAAISIPDLLGFLQMHDKSGVLSVTGPDEVFCLEIERGELVHATSDNPPPHLLLGEILIHYGFIERRIVNRYLENPSPGARLGQVLERDGVVTRDELREALEYQAQQLFNRLFALDNARFSFTACAPPESDGRLRLNMTHLLFEAARARDETA